MNTSIQLPRITTYYRAAKLLEYFLISAVVSLLGIRAYLTATGFPQIGSGNFHIAHMLWGGVLMAIALFLLLSLLGHRIKTVAAIVGGVGFGTFIDELGKFITSDNNYFFEPTIALIYVIFVALFLVIRYAGHLIPETPEKERTNAVAFFLEAVQSDFDHARTTQASAYIASLHSSDPIITHISKLLTTSTTKMHKQSQTAYFFRKVAKNLAKLIHTRLFRRLIIGYFIGHALFVGALILFIFAKVRVPITQNTQIIYFSSVVVANILALSGVYFFVRRKIRMGYRMLLFSLLVSIFVSQFFLFLFDQLASIGTLLGNVLMYIVINHALSDKSTFSSDV